MSRTPGVSGNSDASGRGRDSGTERTAVVIGAGIAGLATAALLAREGYQVQLLEARDEVGGRAGVLHVGGFTFDRGPSWYLMPEVFEHFFALMGTSAAEQLDLVTLDPGYRVFYEREPSLDVRPDVNANVELFESVEPGAGAALRQYLGSAQRIYTAAVAKMLYTTFASPWQLAKAFRPRELALLARVLPQSLQGWVARRFSSERLQQILGYPAVFLGASPALAPALFQLMSHLDLVDGVLYPRGGLGQVTEAISRLALDAGVQLQTGTLVKAILTSSGNRPEVTGVRVQTGDGAVQEIPADVVVSAADLHHTETQLLPPRLASYPERWWERRIAGPGAVLLYLGVRGKLPELTHHNLFFVHHWEDNFAGIFHGEPFPDPASLYVCKPSETDPGVAPEGMENLFVLVPVPADVSLGHGDSGELAGGEASPQVQRIGRAAVEQIAEWARVPDLADRIEVMRSLGPADFAADFHSWKGSALGPAHTLRQSAFFRGSNASSKVSGLYYAGSTTTPGIGLPMCLISAELVLKHLRGDTSVGPLPEPGQR